MKIKIPAQRINQSNNKNSTHRLPEQREYDTGQEYINPLTQILCNSISSSRHQNPRTQKRQRGGLKRHLISTTLPPPKCESVQDFMQSELLVNGNWGFFCSNTNRWSNWLRDACCWKILNLLFDDILLLKGLLCSFLLERSKTHASDNMLVWS